ncbi:hypothetical protein GGR56DRAFT_192425 [Xylariaceae sp. FL0804]|nr:hypothetical protein GGR56DRAFT_192425 [Xylariaceae sp. FL0804]
MLPPYGYLLCHACFASWSHVPLHRRASALSLARSLARSRPIPSRPATAFIVFLVSAPTDNSLPCRLSAGGQSQPSYAMPDHGLVPIRGTGTTGSTSHGPTPLLELIASFPALPWPPRARRRLSLTFPRLPLACPRAPSAVSCRASEKRQTERAHSSIPSIPTVGLRSLPADEPRLARAGPGVCCIVPLRREPLSAPEIAHRGRLSLAY